MTQENQPILDEINRGMFDKDLFELEQAIKNRRLSLNYGPRTGFKIGDRVVLADNIRPLLLQGKTGTITGFPKPGRCSVKLDSPVRRWEEPVCPASILTFAD